jgi:D-arabinose 1-dehydrogenase-like Zn-dependent alcohol dehydrogenase
MPHEVRGVVVRAKDAPATVETIIVPDPGPGEALVAVQACGVCHTDLHYKLGAIGDEFPYLLGHEAAGVVEAVGPGVEQVAPGDYVVLNWRAVCGNCRACRRGRPQYCFATHNAIQKMTLADGVELSPALGIGAFAEKTLVAAGQCTPVDPAARPEAAGLLGCGVMAGLGAAMFTGEIGPGDSVAVFGCGGVGDAAIAGARLAGATTVIAVDLDPSKLELARSFGATDTVDASTTDPVSGFPTSVGNSATSITTRFFRQDSNRGSRSKSTCHTTPSSHAKFTVAQQVMDPEAMSTRSSPYDDSSGEKTLSTASPSPANAPRESHRAPSMTLSRSLTPRKAVLERAIHGAAHEISGIAGRRPSATAKLTTRAICSPFSDTPTSVSVEAPAPAAARFRNPNAPTPLSFASRSRRPSVLLGRNESAPYCHHPSCLNVWTFASAPTKCATATIGGSKFHRPSAP